MTLTFECKLDYAKLNNLLDQFLQSHNNEIIAMMAKCLVLKTDDPQPPTIEKRQSITENIPDTENALDNLFTNTNVLTTRYGDRQT